MKEAVRSNIGNFGLFVFRSNIHFTIIHYKFYELSQNFQNSGIKSKSFGKTPSSYHQDLWGIPANVNIFYDSLQLI